jgi:hypothetical protein
VGEVFCQDSAMDVDCQDCVTCIGHQLIVVSGTSSLPAITLNGYTFSQYSFQNIEPPPLAILRPPIAR